MDRMIRSLLVAMLVSWSLSVFSQTGKERMALDTGWMFSQAGKEDWLPALVPGTVHQDLHRHGLIPDPFYGLNEQKIQWVEDEDWDYRMYFTLTDGQLAREAADLCLEGLDTYADVYLNGALVLRADNMFVGYRLPVKSLLRKGRNCLYVRFISPVRQTLAQRVSDGFDYPADNDHRKEKLSVYTRKAPYSFGWDWGIRMVCCGIWRPVYLELYDRLSVEDFYVRQDKLTDEEALVRGEVCLKPVCTEPFVARVLMSCGLPGEEKVTVEQKVGLEGKICRLDLPLRIPKPERWMPNGWGDPVLYDVDLVVLAGKDTLATARKRLGLRNLRVVKEKDGNGESFYFEVNGVPMFAKGANYIPSDAMLPAVTEERYRRLFRDVRKANMNMLRVWGGGVYEDDLFYDLADENGILVWQDFMFACTAYPHDPVFLKRVEAEAEYNIRRLRQHPCLAMWCGNNEIFEGLRYWGWQKKYSPEVFAGMREGYDLLFHRLLPSAVEKWDKGRFYMHGSPYEANWGRPESWKIADSHNWGVWYGRKPFESLDRDIPRFMSEFGFQAFPEMKTIATFASDGDFSLESEVMNAHQKSSIGNALIRTYMEREYNVPEDFRDFVYVGLVMQGRGMRRGMEAHRRNRPYCMGSLYWQLNDSWPVVSWSGIDYYGNWKALHYQAGRAFAPVALNVLQEGDSLSVWVLSDRLGLREDMKLEFEVSDFRGRILKRKILPVTVLPNASVRVWQGTTEEWAGHDLHSSVCMILTLKDSGGKTLQREPFYFRSPKDLDLPDTEIRTRLKVREGVCELRLKSDRLARDVFVEVPFQGAVFSDNFFDLLPGEEKRITITSPHFRTGENPLVKIRHLRETYK